MKKTKCCLIGVLFMLFFTQAYGEDMSCGARITDCAKQYGDNEEEGVKCVEQVMKDDNCADTDFMAA